MKKMKGITLISLVITIIILIIIAGVSINLSIGENGIFNKAKYAKEDYNNTVVAEEKQLNELYEYLNGEELPENTKETDSGTIVKLPEEWQTGSPSYVSTENGVEVISSKKVANVYAVSVGNAETVPVPEGFYYVGGTLNSGVVISSDYRDKNKYAGIEDVPAGVIYNSNGTVKKYTDNDYEELSKEEKNKILLGNQFVWIPVTKKEYTKKSWDEKSTVEWETYTNTIEYMQIEKYGGFYIGRYEAGTSNITLSSNVNFEGPNTATKLENLKFSIKETTGYTAQGKITLKAGEIPYYHADYFTAYILSQGMYSTNSVKSILVTGTMWDAMIKFISQDNEEIVKLSTWGNYNDGKVDYIKGQGRYGKVDYTSGKISEFKVIDGEYYEGITTTAVSESVKQKNLYDIAGNLWEWTQESAWYDTNERYMQRGGSFRYSYKEYSVGCRSSSKAESTRTDYGFRPALYII